MNAAASQYDRAPIAPIPDLPLTGFEPLPLVIIGVCLVIIALLMYRVTR